MKKIKSMFSEYVQCKVVIVATISFLTVISGMCYLAKIRRTRCCSVNMAFNLAFTTSVEYLQRNDFKNYKCTISIDKGRIEVKSSFCNPQSEIAILSVPKDNNQNIYFQIKKNLNDKTPPTQPLRISLKTAKQICEWNLRQKFDDRFCIDNRSYLILDETDTHYTLRPFRATNGIHFKGMLIAKTGGKLKWL